MKIIELENAITRMKNSMDSLPDFRAQLKDRNGRDRRKHERLGMEMKRRKYENSGKGLVYT